MSNWQTCGSFAGSGFGLTEILDLHRGVVARRSRERGRGRRGEQRHRDHGDDAQPRQAAGEARSCAGMSSRHVTVPELRPKPLVEWSPRFGRLSPVGVSVHRTRAGYSHAGTGRSSTSGDRRLHQSHHHRPGGHDFVDAQQRRVTQDPRTDGPGPTPVPTSPCLRRYDAAVSPAPLRTQVRHAVERAWALAIEDGSLAALEADARPAIEVERPTDADNGDFSTNLAMKLARPYRRPPLELATLLAAKLVRDASCSAERLPGRGSRGGAAGLPQRPA